MRSTLFLTALMLISKTNLWAQSPASFANTQQVMADANHTNGAYFNNGYANWRDTPHCRQCGRRVNPGNRW